MGPNKVAKPKLLMKEDMPKWFHHSSSVRSGYRPINHSVERCLESLGYLHNETGNILTHFFAAMMFVALVPHTILVASDSGLTAASWKDWVLLGLWHISVISCFWNSTVFHIFCCHSEAVNHDCRKADFAGMMFGGVLAPYVSFLFYGFYCSPYTQFFYISTVMLLGLMLIGVSLTKRYSGVEYLPARNVGMMCFFFSVLIPISHLSLMHGFGFAQKAMSLGYFAMFGFCLVLAALAFGSQLPERAIPYRFDYWFNSHQFMHILTASALLFQYWGVLDALQFWHSQNGQCLIPIEDMREGF